jgi:SagB-type dehydrogenase family enzyme
MDARPQSPPERLLRLAEDVSVRSTEDDFVLERPGRILRYGPPDPIARRLAERLTDWTETASLFAFFVAEGGPGAAIAAVSALNAFEDAGFLQEGLRIDGTLVLTCRIYPGSGLGPTAEPAPAAPPFALARHTALSPQDQGWRIASPLARGEVLVMDGRLFAELAFANDGWTPADPISDAMAGLLVKAGLLVEQASRTVRAALATHELWQHALSRRATAPGPVGAVGRPDDERLPPPPRMPPAKATVDLPVPAQPPAMTFQQVLDARSSRRTPDPRACLTSALLGSLLWAAARDLSPPWHDYDGHERHTRPYPAAGGIHAYDLFLALDAPTGALTAFSRYEPDRHCLSPIPGDPAKLLQDAADSMGVETPPQAVIIVSARFGLMTQKYGMASYALMLKDAGVLMQTLHLCATALGIGSCILGGGNSREFARLTGFDPLIEGPIGEIALTGLLGPLTERR